MSSVGIHPPKTPVTKGSMTKAKVTIPNVCKMPGPPAPFVPSPLPNIAKSGMSPKGYSKKVKIEGNTVAIRGASFKSMGDIASKGTGGGLISANTHGPAKFITPGSFTVKIEGKNVHLLGEPMLNNCGPSGSPPNTGATMTGADHKDIDPADCPGHDLEFSEMTEDAEKDRREKQQEKKEKFQERGKEREKLAYYHSKTGRPTKAGLTGDDLLTLALEDYKAADDIGFEQKVQDNTKAVWTGIKFKCKNCSLKGEIDIITPDGVVKECKEPGTVQRDQIEKYNIVGPILLGSSFKGAHMAIPGDKVRTLRRSAASQGLKPGKGKDFDIQTH